MKTYSAKFSNGSITISDNTDKIALLGDYALKKYREIVRKEGTKKNSLPNMYIKEIKKIIREGGQAGKFAWSYWERTRGQSRWNVRRGKPDFTTKWGYSSNNTVRYPVHPSTYRKRKKRKKPAQNQFALIDTKSMYNSFKVSFSGSNQYQVRFSIFSSKTRILKAHEKGISARRGIKVHRKTIEPAKINLMKNPATQKRIQTHMKMLDREIRKYLS